MVDSKYCLCVPSSNIRLYPGCRVKLGRFDIYSWLVQFGWYSWGGNRPVCGWYLTRMEPPNDIKPLQLTDLDDIYLIESSCMPCCEKEASSFGTDHIEDP